MLGVGEAAAFSEEEEDALHATSAAPASDHPVYTLSGQRVTGAAAQKPGLYIRQGRVFLH